MEAEFEDKTADTDTEEENKNNEKRAESDEDFEVVAGLKPKAKKGKEKSGARDDIDLKIVRCLIIVCWFGWDSAQIDTHWESKLSFWLTGMC
jgi:hypothetical protein